MTDYIVTPIDNRFRVRFHGVDAWLTHEQTIRLRDVIDKALRQTLKKDQRCAYNNRCSSAGTRRLVGVNIEFRVCARHAKIMLGASSHLVDKSKG